MSLRSPIVTVLGHVDHGKSSILDAVRGSNIVAGEAGAITQAIGASIIPIDTIKKKIGKLIGNLNLTIPGLLFIDTPGHAAFTSLRTRGGNLADIAILVVDINEGFKPQTLEAVGILKNSKTPFIIAANKLDLVPSFVAKQGTLLEQIGMQSERVVTDIEQKTYELVGVLHDKFSFPSERFDRVENFTNNVAIIPCSAKTGLGLQELLMVLAGLAQKFLEKNLAMESSGPGRGVILEVKDDKGLGKTLDVILYDGTLRVGDTVVYGTLDAPKSTKVRALFQPEPNAEMRDKKGKFKSVKEAVAATGVKLSGPDLEGAAAGMPVMVADSKHIDAIMADVAEQIHKVQINTDTEGVIIKADTLGSLEALIMLLKEKKVPIRKAIVGQISKKDISDAESNAEKHPLYSAILGFNILPVESTDKVKIITNEVIYRIIDDFEEWQETQKKKQEAKELDHICKPCKLEILQNCIFRQSNPCIVGIEVVKGTLKNGCSLMKADGTPLTMVKGIQADKENVSVAERGRQVAISLPKITAGRQVEEMDFLYSDLSEHDFRILKRLAEHLSGDEVEILKDVARIKREHNPVWGV